MSVEFDPVRLGQRRRGVEPAVIGVGVMVVAIVIAIAKPWDPGRATSGPPASEPALAVIGPSASPKVAPTQRVTPGPPDWNGVKDAVTEHAAWGISAVITFRRGGSGIPVSPQDPRYVEQWSPTTSGPDGTDVAVVNREDRAITALGVTVPGGTRARAVRVWRLHDRDELEWINTARIDDLAAARTPVLIRLPLIDGAATTPWDAGHYRVDVLTAVGIHRLSVMITNRFGQVPSPDAWATTAPGVVPATESDPSDIRIGLFATVDGDAVSIPARESTTLGETQAWVDLAVTGGSTVASTYLPRATGLGVMLTSHAAVSAASISRLAPDPLRDPPEASGGISDAQGRTPYIVFPAPDGAVWPPGVYALTVDWEDAAGAHHGTWHVELRPGPG